MTGRPIPAVPALRVEALTDDDARVDLATIAEGRAPEKIVGRCSFVRADEEDLHLEEGLEFGDDFDLVQAERNARRIVAAWNFTRAIELEELERLAEGKGRQ